MICFFVVFGIVVGVVVSSSSPVNIKRDQHLALLNIPAVLRTRKRKSGLPEEEGTLLLAGVILGAPFVGQPGLYNSLASELRVSKQQQQQSRL